MSALIQIRGDEAETWSLKNTVLGVRELGYETDTLKHKLGNGFTHWNDLQYAGTNDGGEASIALQQHIASSNPHPNYDDGVDLVLLYENAKV